MRDLLRRPDEAALRSGDHVPAPLEHRGPDTVAVVELGGTVVAYDRENPAEAWLAYSGCITEVVN